MAKRQAVVRAARLDLIATRFEAQGVYRRLRNSGECRPARAHWAAAISARRFSVLTAGGTPPAQERMSLDQSGVSLRSFFTAAVTSAGEPLASTSRGGMLPRMVSRLADICRNSARVLKMPGL